eukprot:330654-Amorphochlora_amoeboformis.AAC.1
MSLGVTTRSVTFVTWAKARYCFRCSCNFKVRLMENSAFIPSLHFRHSCPPKMSLMERTWGTGRTVRKMRERGMNSGQRSWTLHDGQHRTCHSS